MSDPDASIRMLMTTIKTVVAILFISAFIYTCVAGGYTLSYYTHLGSGETGGWWYGERPTWIPEKWLKWAGYPGSFKKMNGTNAEVMTIFDTKTGVAKVGDCMLACDGENTKPKKPKCVGFVHDTTAKKCYMASSIDLVMPGSSNTVYLYQNTMAPYSPTTRTFQEYTSNALPTTGASVPNYIEQGPYIEANGSIGCAANCYSNTVCTGFTFIDSTKSCGRVSNMDAKKLVSLTGKNSYVYSDVSGTDDATVYWEN